MVGSGCAVAVVSVFVSSTFRDFHGERDALVGPVRAALDELVRPLGCRVEVVDLRWGVAAGDGDADEESRQRRVLDVCLSEIARTRPLFVGLIGDRYGWVPPPARAARVAHEAGLDTDVTGRSVTELEFVHGALGRAELVTPVFFVRELSGEVPPSWRESDAGAGRRLVELRERVAAHPGAIVHRYTAVADGTRLRDLSGFEALAVRVLGPLIEQRARAVVADRNRVDAADAVESLFFADRTTVVAGRDELIAGVVETVRSGQSVCLAGASGVGKSTVWCTAVQQLRDAGVLVAAVPVGAAPGVTSERVVVSRLAPQLGAAVPAAVTSTEQLRQWWRGLLAGAGDVVVAVDSMDSLDAGAAREELGFLTGLPVGVTRLVSTTLTRQADLLERTGTVRVSVGELPAAAVPQVVADLAAALRRELPAAAVRSLASQPRSPLWLVLAVGEMMALDEDDFTAVDPSLDPVAELARLVTMTVERLPRNVADLIGVIAERAEQHHGVGPVGSVAGLLAVSRSGLSPADLTEITGLGDVVVAGVRRAFAGMVEARGAGGRWGFTHGIVRDALGERYLHGDYDLLRETHSGIAKYFSTIDDADPLREDDLLWHTLHSGGVPSAAPVLNHIADTAPARGVRAQRVIADALVAGADLPLATVGLDHDGLRVLLTTDQTHGDDMRVEHRQRLTSAALEHARGLLQANPGSAEANRDVYLSLYRVGATAQEAGDLGRAREAIEESLQIVRRLLQASPGSAGAARDVIVGLYRMGDAAWEAGELSRARDAFEESLQIARGLLQADPSSTQAARDVTMSLLTVGNAARDAGDLGRAREAFEESLHIRRGLLQANPGSAQAARDVSKSLNFVGATAQEAGELGRAREAFEECLQIARGLLQANPGSAPAAYDVRECLNHVGRVAQEAAEPGRAREAFEESLQIARGRLQADPSSAQTTLDVSMSLNDVGRVAQEAGELGRASEAFEESLQIARRLLQANPDSAQVAQVFTLSSLRRAKVSEAAGDMANGVRLVVEAAGVLSASNSPAFEPLKDYVRHWLWGLILQFTEANPSLADACSAAFHTLGGT